MHNKLSANAQPLRRTLLSVAVAGALFGPLAVNATAIGTPLTTINGVVAGSYFTAPVISDNPANAKPSSTAASVYQNAKVCIDVNNNGACDTGEASTHTSPTGTFLLSSTETGHLVAEISTAATNNGHAVAARTVFRVAHQQIAASTVSPLIPVNVAVTPLSTEILRSVENDGLTFAQAQAALAERLGVTAAEVVADPNKVTDLVAQKAILTEANILTNRWTLAAKFVDRQDPQVTPSEVANNPLQPFGGVSGPAITIPEAQEQAMNIEGIPRYDHVFIIMLENKGTQSIKNSPWAPKINGYLSAGNQFTSYFATGNPSEPNYTALGGADDWGINDDNQWNCGATGANAVQDTVIPSNTAPGLTNSPFAATCTQTTNHNIVGRQNLFNALSSNGMTWRTYSESMNPGQDVRTDSIADPAVTAYDNIYAPGTLNGNTSSVGTANLLLPLPASLYKTKHHPGMAYQNVRSAPEFATSNRTLGGGQWTANLVNTTKYTIPANYNYDQFGSDLISGDIGNLNFVIPDQCDDMHGITLTGKVNGTGSSVTASDCTGNNIITRGDNYTDKVIKQIQASPIWTNPAKRVAIVIMFDEGTATSGYNGCCGWNPGNQTNSNPLLITNGTASTPYAVPGYSATVDTSIVGYTSGNRGHGESVFGVLNNQSTAPRGLVDSDYYSHFSFVRTLQDMFGLADPDNEVSYMNRSKYTQKFIAENLLNLPQYANSADTHFDSVRPMNHAYVIPSNYTLKQSSDVAGTPQTGPDATQTNLWALH